MKPGRGLLPIAISVLLLLPLLSRGDLFVDLLFFLLVSILISSFLHAIYLKKAECVILEDTEKVREVLVTEELREILTLSGCGHVSEILLPSWAKAQRVEESDGKVNIHIVYSFPSSGKYTMGSLKVLVSSIIDVLRIGKEVSVKRSFKVRPESSFWLLRALSFLGIGATRGKEATMGGEGGFMWGAFFSSLIFGRKGEEFFGVRPMLPEDNPKMIDWKSSLRSLQLSVKEYKSSPQDLGTTIIADYRCSGSRTCDSIASSLISLGLFLAESGYPSPLLLELPERRTLKFSDSKKLLSYLLEKVIERNLVYLDEAELYELTAPMTLEEIRKILSDLYKEGMQKVYGNPYQWEIFVSPSQVMVTSILHDPLTPIDIASESSSKGYALNIIAPSKPWIDARELEVAYVAKRSYELTVEKLRSLGARVIEWRWKKSEIQN
ncbi:MAG: hypothetical protein C0179_07515 [Fervidicoccus sp.]|nr:MAG: hypothetical protein C0179_07515 [Fervidicoccus sp.]